MILRRPARFEFQINVIFITDNCGKLLNQYGKVNLKLKQKNIKQNFVWYNHYTQEQNTD